MPHMAGEPDGKAVDISAARCMSSMRDAFPRWRVGLAVLVAAVAAGYAVQLGLELEDGDRDIYEYTSVAATGVFVIELLITLAVEKRKFFALPMRYLNLVDVVLTLVAIAETIFWALGEKYFLLKVLKALRVFRAFWVLSFFSGLSYALGVVERVITNFALVLVFGFAILYCNALLLTKFVGGYEPFASDSHIQESYGSVTDSLATLYQLCTLQNAWPKVEYVLDMSGDSYVANFVWILHVECFLFFSYAWFVLVMGGIFKGLMKEMRCEDERASLAHRSKVQVLEKALLDQNKELGNDLWSDDEDEAQGQRAVMQIEELDDIGASVKILGLDWAEVMQTLKYAAKQAGNAEEVRSDAIRSLFTLDKGVTKLDLYKTSFEMIQKLKSSLAMQREETEELRHNVTLLVGLLQQNIQTAANQENLRNKNQDWLKEREQVMGRNEKLTADIINLKRQLQAAKVEAAAARSSIGQKVLKTSSVNLHTGI